MASFFPPVSSRSSIPLAVQRMLTQVHQDQSSILDLQLQLSTGRRLQTTSQDPSATIKVLAAQRQQEFRRQSETNLKSADGILSASEVSLSQAQQLLNEVRGAAIEAAGNTISPDQRVALMNQVDNALSRLVELANSKYADQYLFSGSGVRQEPLRLVGNVVQFMANSDQLNTIADYATTIAANVTAQEAFGVQSNQIVGRVDLNPSITPETPLSSLNRGNGIRLGAIRLSNGIDSLELDLTGSHNLQDVLDKIGSVSMSGRQLNVSLTNQGINIAYTDGLGGMLKVEEVGSGLTASDLGINNTGTPQSSPVIGTDLDPRLSATTRLTQLFAGSGIPINSSLRITQGNTNYTISTNGLQTVQDFLNRIEQSGARVRATIDPSGRYLAVQSTESGSTLSIGENGGTLATSLGLRSMTLDTPVASLNFGAGIGINPLGDDLVFTRNDGTRFTVNLDGVQTINDVLNRINNNVDNFQVGRRIFASLETVGNGIRLSSDLGAQSIAVSSAGGSQAATSLGWTSSALPTATGTNQGSSNVIRGTDVNQVEVEGVFSTVIRLRQAINDQNAEGIQSAWTALDRDLDRINVARGLVGARQQTIANRIDKSADEQIRLKQTESDNLDADLASVISELTHRQAALQASLQLMGQTARMTLFDYL
jgi:flagellar hook-associated protein 3 FlgL